MRVLHTSRFGPPVVGGTERYVMDAIAALGAHGVESLWLTSDRGVSGSVARSRRVVPTIGPAWYMLVPPRAVKSLVEEVDVVHIHDVRFGFRRLVKTASDAGVPVAVSTHGLVFHTRRRRLAKALAWRLVLLDLLKRADIVLADSQFDADACRRRGLSERVIVYPNPVAVPRFVLGDARLLRPRERAASQRTRLLYFGRIDTNKNVVALVRLNAEWPESEVVVVGSGEGREVDRLSRLGREWGAAGVRFLGELSDDELSKQMQEADCLVFPSEYEGFGLTLVEGMATGLPIVANDIAPYRSIASDSGVEFCDVNDVGSLRDAVRRAIDSDRSSDRTSRAMSFAWSVRAGELVAHYEALRR